MEISVSPVPPTSQQYRRVLIRSPQELTFIIKQDIANINKQLAALQAHVKSQQNGSKGSTAGSKQVEEHNANVITLLQSKVMQTTMTFKDVLEIRTQVCSQAAPIELRKLTAPFLAYCFYRT